MRLRGANPRLLTIFASKRLSYSESLLLYVLDVHQLRTDTTAMDFPRSDLPPQGAQAALVRHFPREAGVVEVPVGDGAAEDGPAQTEHALDVGGAEREHLAYLGASLSLRAKTA